MSCANGTGTTLRVTGTREGLESDWRCELPSTGHIISTAFALILLLFLCLFRPVPQFSSQSTQLPDQSGATTDGRKSKMGRSGSWVLAVGSVLSLGIAVFTLVAAAETTGRLASLCRLFQSETRQSQLVGHLRNPTFVLVCEFPLRFGKGAASWAPTVSKSPRPAAAFCQWTRALSTTLPHSSLLR